MSKKNNSKTSMNHHHKSSSDKEMDALKSYIEELSNIPRADEAEKAALFLKHLDGDLNAKERLTEVYLLDSVHIASQFINQGILLADLIQEANIGLLMALHDKDAALDDHSLKQYIHEWVEAVVQKEASEHDVSSHLVNQLQQIDELLKDLSIKYGREPSLSELAEILNITEEEAAQYIQLSLQALS